MTGFHHPIERDEMDFAFAMTDAEFCFDRIEDGATLVCVCINAAEISRATLIALTSESEVKAWEVEAFNAHCWATGEAA